MVFIAELDPRLLTTFVELFPEDALSDVLRGYFLFHNKHILGDEGEGKKKAGTDTSEEGLDTILVSDNDILVSEVFRPGGSIEFPSITI